MTTLDAPARANYGQLFRTRGATPLFALSLANVLGTSLQIFALSVLVYDKTGSAFWSSLAFGAGFLPQLIGGSVLTSLADRLPARPVVMIGAAVRSGSALLLALTLPSAAVAISLVALVAVLQPLPSAVQSSLVSRLLTGELYVLGRSVFSLISSGAQLLGLAAGGAVIAALGAPATFGVAAGVQLLGLLTAFALPSAPSVPAATDTVERWRAGDTWRGNAELLKLPAVRRIVLSWWIPVMALVGAESLVVPYVGDLHRSASSTGVLLAAFPAGAAVGDLIMGRFVPAPLRRRSVPWLYLLMGLALLPLVTKPGIAITFGCFALASAAEAYQLGGQQTFLDAVPDARRGLAFGLVSTGVMSGQGLSPLISGGLADVTSPGPAMAVMGLMIVATAPLLARLPKVSNRPDPAASG